MAWATCAILYLVLGAVFFVGQCAAAPKGAIKTLAEASFLVAHEACDKRRDATVAFLLDSLLSLATEFTEYWTSHADPRIPERWAPCGNTGRNTLYEAAEILCDIQHGYSMRCDPNRPEVISAHVTFANGTQIGFNITGYAAKISAHKYGETPPCNCPFIAPPQGALMDPAQAPGLDKPVLGLPAVKADKTRPPADTTNPPHAKVAPN